MKSSKTKIYGILYTFFVIMVFGFYFANLAVAAEYCVGTAAELQEKLEAAASNDEDDIIRIRIRQEPYIGNFEYIASATELSVASNIAGELPNAIEAGRKAVEAGEQSKERIYVCLGNAWRGWAEGRAGDFEAAKASMARSQIVLDELGGKIIAADWFAAINAEIAFGMGHIEEALALAERAVAIAQKMGGIFAEGWARRIQGQALAALAPPRWDEAEDQLKESLHLLESGQNRVEAAYTHLAWGHVCRDQGNPTATREHWEQAAVQFEASNLTHELGRIHALLTDLVSK